MQNILFIIHSSPYGDEHFFSALRLALQLQEQHKSAVNLKVFLMSDAVTGGLAKQNPSEGYHLQQMLEILTAQGQQLNFVKPVQMLVVSLNYRWRRVWKSAR